MPARVIDGPEKDWLKLGEVLRFTGLTKSTLYRLIERGEFPPASQISPGVRMWHWTHVVYWSFRVQIFGRVAAGEEGEEDEAAA